MANTQRLRNDIATMDRREMEDKVIKGDRNRNDELTEERRSKADKTMADNRLRNDEITSNRREIKDENRDMALAISLTLMILLVGTFFILV